MGKRGIQYASNFLLRLTKHFEWSAIREANKKCVERCWKYPWVYNDKKSSNFGEWGKVIHFSKMLLPSCRRINLFHSVSVILKLSHRICSLHTPYLYSKAVPNSRYDSTPKLSSSCEQALHFESHLILKRIVVLLYHILSLLNYLHSSTRTIINPPNRAANW